MSKKRYLPVVVLMIILVISLGLNVSYFIGWDRNIKDGNVITQKEMGNGSEEYIYITPAVDDPMFVNHDEMALRQFAQDENVKVTILGPKKYDLPKQAEAIDEAIARKPAGILVVGAERGLIPYVNKAVEAGIPTITVDADLVDSKRIAFVGSNWYNIGVKQAEAMAKQIGGKGKVAMMGIGSADNMEQGFEGFKSVMKNYPDVIILGEYDDMSNIQESERITEQLLKEHPDIAGIAGFDSNSAPGIGKAIINEKLVGKVKVTSVDIEPEHLKLVKEGVVQKLVGQKRELFTYYGARLLYDLRHPSITLTANDKKNNITPIPYIIDTGLIEVDQSNVDSILGNAE